MFYSLKTSLAKKRFDRKCRGILQTPPLRTNDAPLRIATLIQHKDLTMYLLACKSFYRHLQEGKFAVINDGSLTKEDKALIKLHLDDPEIFSVDEISVGGLPKGSCWERLVKVLDLSTDNYVIQLDADTLTLSDIPEILNAYRNNVAFTLGTSQGRSIISFNEATAFVASLDSTHVQIVAEKQFGDLSQEKCDRYVRGCAGFAGFPKGNKGREKLDWFSAEMEKRIGQKWHEWGSEQVASNFVVANEPGAFVLPHPQYASFYLHDSTSQLGPDQLYPTSAFLHFLGSFRFSKNKYEREGKRLISSFDAVGA